MSVKQDSKSPNDSGGADIEHWDPTNERDMGAIRRMRTRYPSAFTTMDATKQERLVRIVNNAALEVERMQGSEKDEVREQAASLAESVARTGAILVALKTKDEHHAADHNQRERHHEDDVRRGANEGAKVQTIVLVGAEQSRLLRPPEGT